MTTWFLRGLRLLVALTAILAALCPRFVGAQEGTPSIELHNRETYVALPLKELSARTVIEGPLAKTRISYLAENKHTERIEVTFNLHLPPKTVLTGFGYYYGNRFIPGKMYDKGEAWKVYSAVTSKGRDPGIMDRPSAQDYHAQIFPVEPKRDLRVVLEIVQLAETDKDGAHFTIPLTQGSGYGGNTEVALKDIAVKSEVFVRGHASGDLSVAADEWREAGAAAEVSDDSDERGGYGVARLRGTFQPKKNWRITMKREYEGVALSQYSRLSPGGREGFYALSVAAPRDMKRPRIRLRTNRGTGGTRNSMPTLFGETEAFESLHVLGRYFGPGVLTVTVFDDGNKRRRPLQFTVPLSGEQVADEGDNPAAALWADRRIDQLQNSGRRDFKKDIIKLSQRFSVVSDHTAILAIPQEELDYYRKVLAKRKVNTNTDSMGGGGGDPYIEVKAPAEARQVVAVFPNGDLKSLVWDNTKKVWSGRFDIPWGTQEGAFRVTIIVVQADGTRSRFVLVYQNLLRGPEAGAIDTLALTAKPGEAVQVRVEGKGVRRAVAVAPWGERADLTGENNVWGGTLTVPKTWKTGQTMITVVLLDGAHNRTEVSLDLSVR